MEGGSALAAIISGRVSPSGRLTSTWPMKYGDIPFAMEYSYLNGDLSNEYYREGIYVGYRYFDSFRIKPRYCFGYGLSYTSTRLKLKQAAIQAGSVALEVEVANTGNIVSKEVVQVYVACPAGKLHRESQQLAAYAKTDEIAPGGCTVLDLRFDLRDLAAFDEEEAAFVLEQGDYIVSIGHFSRNSSKALVISLDSHVTVSRHDHILPLSSSFSELKSENHSDDSGVIVTDSPADNSLAGDIITEDYISGDSFASTYHNHQEGSLKRLQISSSDIPTLEYKYNKPAVYKDDRVDEIMNRLTVKDMINVVVGSGMFIARNRIDVPGSVGNTTSRLYKMDCTQQLSIICAIIRRTTAIRSQAMSMNARCAKFILRASELRFRKHAPQLS